MSWIIRRLDCDDLRLEIVPASKGQGGLITWDDQEFSTKEIALISALTDLNNEINQISQEMRRLIDEYGG